MVLQRTAGRRAWAAAREIERANGIRRISGGEGVPSASAGAAGKRLQLGALYKMPHGGHFACLEQPQLFVQDVWTFFRKVRG